LLLESGVLPSWAGPAEPATAATGVVPELDARIPDAAGTATDAAADAAG
jgi:hypothetical protein